MDHRSFDVQNLSARIVLLTSLFFSLAIVRFKQKILRSGDKITSALCVPPTPGVLQFQVGAYNKYGSVYGNHTKFYYCGVSES